jgi:Na+-transporting methylmalonyl-CoA/oxaloacetate decarboxylase gamma subunit
MEVIFIVAGVGMLIINLIILISITKIADNSDAIRKMLREEIKGRREKDDPTEQSVSETKPAKVARILLECPGCHAKEELNRSDMKDIFAYKNFLMKYNRILNTMKFECKACGRTFVKFKNI